MWSPTFITYIYIKARSTTSNEAKGYNLPSSSRETQKPFVTVRDLFVIISKFVLELPPLPSKKNKHNYHGQLLLSTFIVAHRVVPEPQKDE